MAALSSEHDRCTGRSSSTRKRRRRGAVIAMGGVAGLHGGGLAVLAAALLLAAAFLSSTVTAQQQPTEKTTSAISNIMQPRATGPALQFTGNTAYPYSACQGDCDTDADCTPGLGLYCFQRDGNDEVPGCTGGGSGDRRDVDYCVYGEGFGEAEEGEEGEEEEGEEEEEQGDIEDVAGDTDGFRLGRCEADCDDDSECETGLICYQRSGDEPVPGCNGTPRSGWDYCVQMSDAKIAEEMPLDTDEPTREPTIGTGEPTVEVVVEETEEPTLKPTSKPTLPKVGTIYTYKDGSEPTKLDRCHGDCNKDSDCTTNLICYIRTNRSPDEVFGCKGKADGGSDYCIDPNDLPPTGVPTVSPTRVPTWTPTDGPTKRPTWNPTRMPVPWPTTADPTVRPTPRPTPKPQQQQEVFEPEEDEEATIVDLYPNTNEEDEDEEDESFDDGDTTAWVSLSPFELSLDFQTINQRRTKKGRRLLRSTDDDGGGTGASNANVENEASSSSSSLRHLQMLSGMIDTTNLENVLKDVIGNEMGALSDNYRRLDLDIDLVDEESYEDGRITVTYDVSGRAGFDTTAAGGAGGGGNEEDAAPPSEEEVRRATEEAMEDDDALIRDLRRLGDRDLVLSSVQDVSVEFEDPSSPFFVEGGDEEGGGAQPSSTSPQTNLVEILVLVIIVVVCVGTTTLAILYVRKRRKAKAVKEDIEKNRAKMEEERKKRQSSRSRSKSRQRNSSSSPVKAQDANGKPAVVTPPAKAFQAASGTPPTPTLTPSPPPATINVTKSRSLPNKNKAASTRKELFIKDTLPKHNRLKRQSAPPSNARHVRQSNIVRDDDGDSTLPDPPPDYDLENGESTQGPSVSDWSVSGIGLDRPRSTPSNMYMENSGLASLTSVENIDSETDGDASTLGARLETDNTVSSLSDNLTFGGTAAGESIVLGEGGIRLESVLNLDEEHADNISDLGEGSFGNKPRYRASSRRKAQKKGKVSKKNRVPPMPSAAASDLEGQVKAFEEHVLGISMAQQQNLPSRLRLRGEE